MGEIYLCCYNLLQLSTYIEEEINNLGTIFVLSCGVPEISSFSKPLEKILEYIRWKFHFNKVICQKVY